MVSEALLGNDEWSQGMFDAYVAERADRMSRLRTTARLTSLRDAAFGAEGRRLRAAIHERIAAKSDLMAPFLAAFIGPDSLPAEVFEAPFVDSIVGTDIWDFALP